jgi:hypothetical protein
MSRQQKRLIYISLTSLVLVLFAGGVIAGYMGRHNKLCKDGKPPRQQQDTGIGQVEYLCQNGQIVTK